MKCEVTGLRYEHPDHGAFVVTVITTRLCIVTRYHGAHGAQQSERLADAKDRHEARRVIRARIAELNAKPAHPLCTGEGQVRCA